MEKLRMTETVLNFLADDNSSTFFESDLSDKEERYFLHRELGKLTNLEVSFISKRQVTNNKQVQELISKWDVEKLVAYGFLEKVIDNSRNYELRIRFNDDGEVSEIFLTDRINGKCVAFTSSEIYARAAVKALVTYAKYLRG